ncbi:MAG: serine/threonine phosphatase [Cyanobacteria bacterium J06560_2]
MLTCANCQFANPVDHKFCQRCGTPLMSALPQKAATSTVSAALQIRLLPPEGIKLTPTDFLSPRYQILTVLSQGCAYTKDMTPAVRSPLQQQLATLTQKSAAQSGPINLHELKAIERLPEAAYPYFLLAEAAPTLHDAWEQENTAVIVTPEWPALSSVIQAFSTAVDPLQHVYWMYVLTDLWKGLAPLPQWRSSLLLANNLGIDTDQSLRVKQFIPPLPSDTSGPSLSDLKAFLQSLLAQPHRGAVDTLRQIRQLILAVSSAKTLEQLRAELTTLGEALLATPAAITPASSSAAADTSDFPIPITMPPKSTDSADVPAPNDQLPVGEPPVKTSPESTTPEDRLLETTVLQDSMELEDLPESGESTMVLPMKLVSLEDAGQTDVGHQRDHNEDCFLIARESRTYSDNKGQRTTAHGLYILCDGMGGHDGGEVASQLAAKTLSEYFEIHWPSPQPNEEARSLPDEKTVVEAVKLANQAIYEVNEQEGRAGHERMGTTLVVVLLQGTSAVVAHVGDSRLYRHSRRTGLSQVTTDHEVGQREIERGIDPEIAYARPDAYQLTQALGPRGKEDLAPSVSYLSFSEDTLLLLCSDGLSDNDVVEDYLDSHIDPLLRGKKTLDTGIDELVQLSNEVNGHDNITAVAALLKVSPDLEKGRLATEK